MSLMPTALGVAREKQTLHPSPYPCNLSPSLVSRPLFTTQTCKHVHMTCQHARMCQPPAHTDVPGCQHTLQQAQMRSTHASRYIQMCQHTPTMRAYVQDGVDDWGAVWEL